MSELQHTFIYTYIHTEGIIHTILQHRHTRKHTRVYTKYAYKTNTVEFSKLRRKDNNQVVGAVKKKHKHMGMFEV